MKLGLQALKTASNKTIQADVDQLLLLEKGPVLNFLLGFHTRPQAFCALDKCRRYISWPLGSVPHAAPLGRTSLPNVILLHQSCNMLQCWRSCNPWIPVAISPETPGRIPQWHLERGLHRDPTTDRNPRICCFRLLSPWSSSPFNYHVPRVPLSITTYPDLSTAWGQNKHVADIEARELVGTARELLVPFMKDWMMKEDMKLSDGIWNNDTKSKGFKRPMLNLRWICYWTPPLGDCKGPQNTQCRWPWCWGSSVFVGKWLGKQQIVIVEHVHPISCNHDFQDDPMALPELPMSICSSKSLPQERVLSVNISESSGMGTCNTARTARTFLVEALTYKGFCNNLEHQEVDLLKTWGNLEIWKKGENIPGTCIIITCYYSIYANNVRQTVVVAN